jgi:transcriptional regulator with XRE-family HTH domain
LIREGTVSKKTNITSAQIRAARALLNWSARELAERSGISQSSIHRAERAKAHPSMHEQSLATIKATFERYGVEFLDNSGVRLRPDQPSGSQAGGTPISRKPDIENRPEMPGGHWRMDRRSTG